MAVIQAANADCAVYAYIKHIRRTAGRERRERNLDPPGAVIEVFQEQLAHFDGGMVGQVSQFSQPFGPGWLVPSDKDLGRSGINPSAYCIGEIAVGEQPHGIAKERHIAHVPIRVRDQCEFVEVG